MGLSVGIVGLPNVGKSTLFNALLKKQVSFAEASAGQAGSGSHALVGNYPFTTIEPNVGVVPVPDNRLKQLSQVVKDSENLAFFPPEVPATVEFLDIAGLIKGASKGEGLGNKFLSHIREVDAICHVVRSFSDPEIVKQGVEDPVSDLEVVETELKLADFQTLEKQHDPGNTPDKELKKRYGVALKLKAALEKGIPAREVELSEEEEKIAKQLSLLTAKPILVVLNVDEEELKKASEMERAFAEKMKLEKDQVIAICAKTESELASLSDDDQAEYLKELGVESSGLERLIKKAFATLGLITFLTAGEKEVRAWTIKQETRAQDAAGEIHTDFIKNFIKADVVDFADFIDCDSFASTHTLVGRGGWKNAREQGKVRSEGKDYIVKDGDVIEFKIGV